MLCVLSLWATVSTAQTLRYLGRQVVPDTQQFAATRVGGLSGLDYMEERQRFVAISDDRSEHAPARFYEIELDLSEFNTRPTPSNAGVRFLGITTLKDEHGAPYAEGTVDPEAIRRAPAGDRLYWTSEGNAGKGIAPAIVEIDRDGRARRQFDLPAYYRPAGDAGVRHNLAFESLAIDSKEGRLYVGTENALLQDGPTADVEQGSPSRLLVYSLKEGTRIGEYVYPVDPVPAKTSLPLMYRTNGLVELLAGDGMLLALERAYVMGAGNFAKVYRLDLTGATNVAGQSSLRGMTYASVSKTLLFDLRNLDIPLDNLEGMSWGPRLPSGNRSLILVSDNNFSARQTTQFLAFEVVE
jgi:3-phytase/alkaline phosphatase D